MEKKAKNRIRIFLLILLPLLAALSLCSFLNGVYQEGTEDFGLYTFQRKTVAEDGTSVVFYESGDQYFRYYHDQEGFILIKKEDGLYYAQNKNGRPEASNVKYTAAKFARNRFPKMLASQIDFKNNPDLLTEYPVAESFRPEALLQNASGDPPSTIANIIIYIIFKDDTVDLTGNPVASLLEGNNPSLADYFYRASDGDILIDTFYPMNGSLVYVYRAPEDRSYYNVDSTSTRGKREAVLLTSAVNSASARFDFGGADLDTNDDGFIDSVGFLIGGSSDSTWGGLLWPHSWNLASINEYYNHSASAAIGGLEVGNYSFNFTTSINVGVLCHEFFHVLGAPDLYHYDYDFVPVGDWDLMQFNKDIPQLPLTYMRTKYLGISQDRVGTIEYNGVYSLNPTVTASPNDYFAYKIPTGESGQYLMVEYRNHAVYSTYDSQLPRSGLIVYRIKEGVAEGNKDALYQNPRYPDEVYVYRPRVASTGDETNNNTRYAASKTDIAYAALSPYNTHFTSVGVPLGTPTDPYDYDTLFYIDGTNSGIVIEALSMTDASIEFRVHLSSANSIPNEYFDDKIAATQAELINADYSGARVAFSLSEMELNYLKDIRVKLKSADGQVVVENKLNLSKFRTEYEGGERIFESKFVINDKGFPIDSVFLAGEINYELEPAIAEISVTDGDNDTKVLDSMLVAKLVSWQEVLATRAELHADISAASRITLGVRKDGTVERSGGFTEGQWAVQGYSNIISAKAGHSHTLLLNAQRRVVSIGSNDYGEAYVTNWQDILRIEAGYNTSYAINLQGRVFAVGDNNYGQLNVAAWADIVSISAGVRHVAGVDKYGVVYTAGANTDGQRNISGINNAKAVACGATFTACLLEDGTVAVAGTLANADAVADWTDIIKLSAGENFIVGLKSDKTVVAAGVNNAGQCLVGELQDIIEIAAGEHHAAFLREDGMVLFTGSANGDYHVTEGIGNLIHDNYVYAEGIQFSMNRTEIYLGIQNEMSYALCSASVYPSSATYKKVTYLSADPSVATVSAGGTVIAVGSGTTTITAKVNGTDIGAEIEITVKEYIEIESIAFVDPIITIVEGNSIALMLVYAPSGATVYGEITYSSENPTLATVNGNGLLTACGGYGEVTVSALLSQDGEQYSAECTVVIVSTVSGIEVVSLPTKTVYRYNEDFDESGGKIRITYQDQTTSDQSVVSSMISGYDKTQCGEQIITISYLDATATFSVTVQNYIKDAKLFSAGKTEYKYDESLDLNNMIITKEWADGSTTTSSLPTGTVVSGYDKNEVGFQTVTLTFELEETIYEVSYTVNVLDIVLYILGDAITKTTYLYGEPLRMTEPILMYMVSGAQKTIPLSDAVITGYDPMLCGVHPTKVEYFDIVGGQTHDFIIVFTVELAGQVNVYSVDSIGDRHLYLWPEFIYYTVGGALPIEVAYGLTDGRQIELGADTAENIFYSIESFNAANNGPGSALIKLQYKRNKMIAGGEITTEVVSRYTELYVYGDGAFEIIDIGGEKTILYGQTLDLVVYTVDEYGDPGGGAPDRIVYDTELTGTPQTCTVYYRNKVDYTTITILDYVVELVPISDREIVYGESVELQVTGIKAKAGAVLLGPDEYEVTGLYTTQLGEHLVQVICGELTASFTLRVLDTIQSLTVNTPIASTCLFGQEPDFSSDYLCMMASGDTELIAFNTNDFTVSSFDNRLMTTQTVRITHKQTGTEFRFGVTVLNYVASISVAAGAKTEYHFGEELSFGIVSIMANEVMQTIELSDCTITGYNQYQIATQTVTVTYKGVSTTIDVTVQDTVASLILQRAPFETDYGYGQALSYIGGVLIIHYSSGDTKTYEGTAIGAVACSYNPKAVGKQTVTLSIGSATATFNVTVGAKQESTYCLAESSFLTQKENSIVYNHSMTAEELRQNLTVAEYLWARIKKANGQFLALNDMDDEILRSDDILQIVNQAGYVVLSYQLYLEGDANCDGVLDEDDVAALALGLISGEYDRDMTDYDKDGVFTLTDFVNWARKAAPPVSPLNQMAKAFINDGIGKKREELL